jgi:hypothetical protein
MLLFNPAALADDQPAIIGARLRALREVP